MGLIKCEKCGELKFPHTTCQNCGTYHNRSVLDVLKKLTKKEKKQKEKELAQQEEAKQVSKK
jgi:large subunit ribosomal protein L32